MPSTGRITQVIGPVVDVEFADGNLPADLQRAPGHQPGHQRPAVEPGPRGRAAPRREHGPRHRDGLDRRPGARHGGPGHRRRHHGAGRRGDARPDHERDRRAGGRARTDPVGEALPDPSRRRPTFTDQATAGPGVRDRHQGRRPARALSARRQDRAVRRRRRRQDRHHPWSSSTTSPSSTAACRCSRGVGERTREGNDLYVEMQEAKLSDGKPGHLAHGAGLRTDERAARRPRPRRPHRR